MLPVERANREPGRDQGFRQLIIGRLAGEHLPLLAQAGQGGRDKQPLRCGRKRGDELRRPSAEARPQLIMTSGPLPPGLAAWDRSSAGGLALL